ncbi:MAG: efflux RND transporter periplasmic adaptor subunit [Candidatus Aminicenantes bacterium]|nr:efflux RND transporter periplasmic adaptor subunit [Candidatus Aminicenantes bacterium]
MKSLKIRNFVVIAAAAALIVFAGACKKEGAASPAAGGGRARVQFPVDTITVQVRSLVYSVTAVGSVEAFEKVQVTARVPGVADRVLFSEGGFAAADQVLVEIETERYRLAVEAAQAAFDKSEASKADAEAGLKRRVTVITQTPGLIPGEEVEAWRTKVLVAASEVAQARSALNQAKLNLRDAFVRAPISGIIQTRTVQTGQYVQTGTVLATLVRRDPLLLRFKVPERDASRIKPGQEARFRVREDSREFTAKVVHVAESADDVSRLVDITANIDDPSDRTLRPGSFAEITVPVSSTREAAVIPVSAVRPSERGFIAFVVDGGKAVERILTLGMKSADGQVEVLSGLKVGEALVIRGSEALQDGVTVRVNVPGAEQAPAGKPVDKQAPPAKKG